MLGQKILDPERVESPAPEVNGLGLLPLTTLFSNVKETHQIEGEVVVGVGLLAGAQGAHIKGYEIHMGTSYGKPASVPFSLARHGQEQTLQLEGALDAEGRVMGTYIHGLFHNAVFRRTVLRNIAVARGKTMPEETTTQIKDVEYDKLAALVSCNLDMDLIYDAAGLRKAATNE